MLEFITRISSQGKGLIIWIPKEFLKDAKSFRGKQVKVSIDEALR